MSQSNIRLGIILMISTTFVFSIMDAITGYLGRIYPAPLILMIRYWMFASFVMTIAAREKGGIRRTVRTAYPWLQLLRSLLLVGEIGCMLVSLAWLGLIETHAVFSAYPLIVAALSGPVLGEKVGWRRWVAIGIGFVGVVIILKPGVGVFSPLAILPLAAAFMFALYGLLTRYVSDQDRASTSFFWASCVGAVVITALGIWYWEPMTPYDWVWMLALGGSSVLGHGLLIKCYEVAEASAVQPFAYFQLMFVSVIGLFVFNETLEWNVILGGCIVVSAGVFTLIRARLSRQKMPA